MALFELSAFEAAYQALQPLDAAARRRALHWLSDALGVQQALAEAEPTDVPAAAPQAAAAASRPGRSRSTHSGGRGRRPVNAPSARRRRGRSGDSTGNERA